MMKTPPGGLGGTDHDHGIFNSDVPGRTDKLNVNVPADGYVIPADIVSALGEGNTMAGRKVLDHLFGPVKAGMAKGGKVPIVVAGGEYYVNPEAVKKIGDGDVKKGHDALDHFVLKVRGDTVKKLKGLKGPKGMKKKK